MMDWSSSGRHDAFRFVEVDPVNLRDIRPVSNIEDGGQIEYNQLTELKVSGSVPFIGSLDLGHNYLRVYVDCTLGSESTTVVLGTFMLAAPSLSMSDKASSGSADLISILQHLVNRRTYETFSLTAGSPIIKTAQSLAVSAGLFVVATPSKATTSSSKTWEAGTKYIEIVNDLLALAGYATCGIDGMGNAVFSPYYDPAGLSPVAVLRAGPRSVFAPTVSYDFDYYNVPNVVTAVMSNQERSLCATVRNDSPNNRYSTVRRGEEIGEVVTVSDAENAGALSAIALRELQNRTSATESITLEHSYQPITIGEAMAVEYPEAGLSFTGVVSKQSVSLRPGIICQTHLQRFVRF